jgi:hypothetical protein
MFDHIANRNVGGRGEPFQFFSSTSDNSPGNSVLKRSALIGLRVEPTVKSATERAAVDERRSVSSLVEKILVAYLQRRGYLPRDVRSNQPLG